MASYRVLVARRQRSPLRPQVWDASIHAGDDFILRAVVMDEATGQPVAMDAVAAAMFLVPDRWRQGWFSPDYGLGWFTQATWTGFPNTIRVDGVPFPDEIGAIGFVLLSGDTTNLPRHRYRISVQIDLPEGLRSAVEGILQVRELWTPTLFPGDLTSDGGVVVLRTVFGYPRSPLGLNPGQLWNNGQTIGITPGPVVPGPPVALSGLRAAVLLALGGAGLPIIEPPDGSGLLWNNGGVVCVA